MSVELGNELPDDLFHALWSEDVSQQVGKAVVVTTVDSEGWAHPAIVSYREVGARDRNSLVLVTHNGTRTTDNLRQNGKVTLLFVDERMVYYVKGSAAEVPGHLVGLPAHFATMHVTITQVLRDFITTREEGPLITTGIMFRQRSGARAQAEP